MQIPEAIFNPRLQSFIQEFVPEYLHEFIHDELETQINLRDYPFRAPLNLTNKDRLPDSVKLVGSSGWDYVNNKYIFADWEHDLGHGNNAQSQKELDELIHLYKDIEGIVVTRSTGGKGLHVRLRICPLKAPATIQQGRSTYALLSEVARDQVAKEIDTDLGSKVCATGRILWLGTSNPTPDSFSLLINNQGQYTVDVPLDSDGVVALTNKRKPRAPAPINSEGSEFNDRQWAIAMTSSPNPIAFTTNDGNEFANIHTCLLAKCLDNFSTKSKGTNLNEANATLWPLKGDAFMVVKYGQNEDWALTAQGNSYVIVGAPHDFGSLKTNYHSTAIDGTTQEFSTCNTAAVLKSVGLKPPTSTHEDKSCQMKRCVGGVVRFSVPRSESDTPSGVWKAEKGNFVAAINEKPFSSMWPAERVDQFCVLVHKANKSLGHFILNDLTRSWVSVRPDQARSKINTRVGNPAWAKRVFDNLTDQPFEAVSIPLDRKSVV